MSRNPRIAGLFLAAMTLGGAGAREAFAEATEDSTPRAARIPTEASRHAEQADHLQPHDEAVWIGEGESRFLAIRRASAIPSTEGTFVLVRNRAAGSDAPDRLGYLRENLPRLGWSTLVLDLPDPPGVVVPTRARERTGSVAAGLRNGRSPSNETPPAVEPAAAAAPARPAAQAPSVEAADRDRIVARLSAAAIEAGRGAQPVVMVGEGEAAAWVARVNGASPVVTSVIALNIDDSGMQIDGQPVSHWILGLSVPSLLLQEAPRRWSADDRLSASTELRLLPSGHPSGEERLLRQVRGWLTRRQSG